MPKDEPEMTASDVIEIAQLLDQNRIDVWIDGATRRDGQQVRYDHEL